jgi:D-alanyl-lipoteichoic acid acyltransferase DltB (MBOAT superfamily)
VTGLGTNELLSAKPEFVGTGTLWEQVPTGARLRTNDTSGYQVRWPLDGLHQGPGGVCIEADVRSGAIHVGLLDREQNRFLDSCILKPTAGTGTLRFDQAQGRTLILSNASGGTVSEAIVRIAEIRAPGALPEPPAPVAVAPSSNREDQLADNRYSGSPPYLFSSWEFVFLFLPVTLSLAAIARTRGASLVGVLVLASFLWYSAWDVRFAPLIAASILGNWLLGKWVARSGSKRVLALAVFINLLPLVWFKYTRFGFATVGLRSEDWILPDFLPAVLPLGISFYTFQQIGYIIDVRSRPEQQEPSFWRYALFVLFFPQLVAGPIVQHRQFLPQVGQVRDMPSWFAKGLAYFALGVGKKLLIADPIGASIDPFFSADGCTDASQAWAAIIGYGCQLYFDFSGYSDMAIGLGAMFGFDIPVNFMSPYKASSITEFWRRWHMTLSVFLRDYVYIPLGGNRGRPWTRYRNLMLTMLIGGLWHGAGWAFVLWGGLHGALLAAEHYCRGRFPGISFGWLARPLTLLAVLLLWVPFRTEDVEVAFGILSKAIVPGWTIDSRLSAYCLGGLLIATLAPNSHSIAPRIATWPRAVAEAAWGFACRSGAYALAALAALSVAISTYYTERWDVSLAQGRLTSATERAIGNKQGDLRNNMLRVEALAHAGPKWIVAGPSFATGMPTFLVPRKEKDSVTAGCAGIGGQALGNWGRTAMAICDMPGVEAIVIAVSPVSLTGAVDVAPFESQGWDLMQSLGIKPKATNRLSTLGPTQLSVTEVASALTTADIREARWFQLHGYARLLLESTWHTAASPELLTPERRAAGAARLETWRKGDSGQAVNDQSNGTDAKFRWHSRGVIESISEGGAAWESFEALRDHAAHRGVRLVVYETPTVSVADSAAHYPPAFWDEYSRRMRLMSDELGIEYWDLSHFLPWSGSAMRDFVHPSTAAREVLLIELCRRMQDSNGSNTR